jgi:hypothetical protein
VHVPTICIARMRFNGVTFNYAESTWMAISRSSGNFFRANSPYLMGKFSEPYMVKVIAYRYCLAHGDNPSKFFPAERQRKP